MRFNPCLWLAGYSQSLAENVGLSPADRARLELVGGGVVLSCAIAAFNIGLASTWITSGATFTTQTVVALCAAAAGVFYVLAWDRGLIVAADQQVGGRSILPFRMLRILLIMVFSASSVLKIAPSFLHTELRSQAAQLQEAKDASRSDALARQYDLGGLAGRESASREDVARLRRSLASVPPPIATALTQASRCSADLARDRRQAIAAGTSLRDAFRRYAPAAAECRRQRRAANSALAAHRAAIAAELTETKGRADDLTNKLRSAEKEVSERSAAGRDTDRDTLTAGSLETLLVLIRNDRLALIQLIALYLMLSFAEGAGLLLKGALGRSEAGEQIGTDRAITSEEAKARMAVAIEEAKAQIAVAQVQTRARIASEQAFAEAMIDCLRSPEVTAELRRASARLAGVTAPMAAAALAAHQVEDRSREIGRIVRMNPNLAAILGDILEDALAAAARNFAERPA